MGKDKQESHFREFTFTLPPLHVLRGENDKDFVIVPGGMDVAEETARRKKDKPKKHCCTIM